MRYHGWRYVPFSVYAVKVDDRWEMMRERCGVGHSGTTIWVHEYVGRSMTYALNKKLPEPYNSPFVTHWSCSIATFGE